MKSTQIKVSDLVIDYFRQMGDFDNADLVNLFSSWGAPICGTSSVHISKGDGIWYGAISPAPNENGVHHSDLNVHAKGIFLYKGCDDAYIV